MGIPFASSFGTDLGSSQVWPHLINEGPFRLFLFLLTPGVPCPNFQEPEHVHAVDFIKSPAGFHQRVVGGVNVIGQRQDSVAVSGIGSVTGASSVAAFVGKSESTSVVCACTAMSASAMSCISRSTG